MDITLLIRLAISFLETAVKNPDSKKAKNIARFVRQLRDIANDYLEVFDPDNPATKGAKR